jgi:hypothetical protein
MSTLKIAALAAAVLGGSLASAEAQPYGHWGHGQGYGHYRPAPHAYVHPRIARKQAQLNERFVQKFGYVYPHAYHAPRPRWGHGHGYNHRPRPHVQYQYGW